MTPVTFINIFEIDRSMDEFAVTAHPAIYTVTVAVDGAQ